jgi:hypothetical protein
MRIVDIHEAKNQFSKLVDSVLQGNEILITMAGNLLQNWGRLLQSLQGNLGC